MRIAAFIPSRYSSTRFAGKPLALIHGKPMIRHVYERALKCRGLSEVYIATDDDRIRLCVEGFGGKVVMTSPTHPCGTDRVREAASLVGIEDNDIVVNIQGDQPAFNPDCLSLLIEGLLKEEKAPMLTLVYRMPRGMNPDDPSDVKVVADRKGYALYFSRSVIPFYWEDSGE